MVCCICNKDFVNWFLPRLKRKQYSGLFSRTLCIVAALEVPKKCLTFFKFRPPDIKKSHKSKMTTTENYRPRLLPTTDVPSQENRLKLAIKRLLNEYPSEKNGCDEKTIDRSEEESRMAFSKETAHVVQRWDEAQKKYSKMKLNDYRKAERFLLSKFRK